MGKKSMKSLKKIKYHSFDGRMIFAFKLKKLPKLEEVEKALDGEEIEYEWVDVTNDYLHKQERS